MTFTSGNTGEPGFPSEHSSNCNSSRTAFQCLAYQIIFLSVFTSIISCSSTHNSVLFTKEDWTQSGNANWTFQDGEWLGMVKDGSGFLISQKTYTDFTIDLEFYPDSTINSGVFVRCQNLQLNPTNCYEVNIWDLHPIQNYSTGAIVTRAIPLRNKKTINKWNRYHITMQGKRLRVYLNGTLTADISNADFEGGPIALQATGTGQIRFRNIRIKPE